MEQQDFIVGSGAKSKCFWWYFKAVNQYWNQRTDENRIQGQNIDIFSDQRQRFYSPIDTHWGIAKSTEKNQREELE